jgi:serine/threonine protein kinase
MCGTFVGTFKYMSPERIRNQPYSYLSDIWSFGLVMMECVTGRYPFEEHHSSCIEMAQTILDCAVPKLSPTRYSTSFIDFVESCISRDPQRRPPADVLLSAPWLEEQGATSYDVCVNNVNAWINGMSAGRK